MHFTHILADLLASGNTVRFTAPGGSMHPVIRHGDVLLVDPLDRPARAGDILLYLACGRPVAHRLIAIAPGKDGPALILKGDSAACPDLPVRSDQVLGRVVAVEREGRRIDLYSLWTAACCLAFSTASRIKSAFLKLRNPERGIAFQRQRIRLRSRVWNLVRSGGGSRRKLPG
jgi:signal peptidase